MIKSCQIKNFRGFSHLSLDSLERVNLLIGKNNVGKTALLEAIFLLFGCSNPELVLRINIFRNMDIITLDSFSWIFHNNAVHEPIEISCTEEHKKPHTLAIRLKSPDKSEISMINESTLVSDQTRSFSTNLENKIIELRYSYGKESFDTYIKLNAAKLEFTPFEKSPFAPAIFLPNARIVSSKENAERLSKVISLGQDEELVEILKNTIEPNLQRLALSYSQGSVGIVADLGRQPLMPINYMGDGINRLLSILLAISSAPKGFVLIDEIENGFHYSVLPTVWGAIGKLAKKLDTQIFATTHSLECAVAAHDAFEKEQTYDFQLHRLEKVENKIKTVTFDKDSFTTAIKQNWEVR